MKKLIGIFLLGILYFQASAQIVEIKANPVRFFYKEFDISSELLLPYNFAIEGQMNFDREEIDIIEIDGRESTHDGGVFSAGAAIKYYLGNKRGWDRFYLGGYGRYRKGVYEVYKDAVNMDQERVAFGGMAGFKWVTKHNIVFEIGAGLGRTFVEDVYYLDHYYKKPDQPLKGFDGFGTIKVGYRI